ncbi:HK97 family phage prohead protease [Bradyrhizobium sp. C-145]|uniref:phage major capsid protein n=1 Tax=Bradyrhizobium sp. C-145 TaxID=574727 RepID=UPI00201B94D1|nr:HK97 family phage prohead protease [Bradyrhizobium sp. C-145]UQR67356.1 HK97 family phage prohead protease [Bradyrhizobium sp. C-145]
MTKLLVREAAALETRRAPLRPSSYNAEAGTIEAIISTGAAVTRSDANGQFTEILDTAAADLTTLRGASVLNSHRQNGLENILGTVEEAWREGNNIVARMRLSNRPEVASLVAAVRNGEINSVSIGYEVSQWADGTDANGQRVRTATQWKIREVSFVAVPADPHARTRGATNGLIRSLGQQAGVSQATIDGLIDRGATEAEARSAILDELLQRSNTTVIRTSHNIHTMDNSEAFVRAVGGALYARVEASYQPDGAERQYVGHTMLDVAREVLRRSGLSTTGLAASALIERALTTSDFPQILANTVGRTLRASYGQPASGIRQLARQTTANDFRAKTKLMLDSAGVTLEKVNEHGEFKSGSLVEAGESYKLATFGRIISFTRQAIVNDDLGAFTDIARRLGLAAQAFEAQQLVDLLQSNAGVGPNMSDGKALHHVDHGNIAAVGGPLNLTTLSAARLAMRKQTGPAGALITVTPRYLLVPSDLETSAESWLTEIHATTTADVNPFSRLSLVVEPRLTSATRWWLAADKAEVDGLEYAHLAGAPGPQTESRAGFEVDGVQTKVRLDFGAGFVDWRGWYTNAGQ